MSQKFLNKLQKYLEFNCDPFINCWIFCLKYHTIYLQNRFDWMGWISGVIISEIQSSLVILNENVILKSLD